jgi:hypothetical protein
MLSCEVKEISKKRFTEQEIVILKTRNMSKEPTKSKKKNYHLWSYYRQKLQSSKMTGVIIKVHYREILMTMKKGVISIGESTP